MARTDKGKGAAIEEAVRYARTEGMRAMASALVGRNNFAAKFGQSHWDSATGLYDRKLTTALGYIESPTVKDYRGWYERGGIAERVLEAYPRATWGGGCVLMEDEDPETETQFEAAVAQLVRDHSLWSRMMRADILAGMGQYSVLMIGLSGGELSEPVGGGELLYINPLPEDRAEIAEWDKDATSPRYGMPEIYNLEIGTKAEASSVDTETIPTHWSRVVHLAEGLLEDDVFGKPRLRPVLNHMFDLAKIVGGGAEAAWLRMNPGFQMDFDPSEELDEDDITALTDQLDEYAHKARRFITTRGVKMNPLSLNVTNFGPNAEAVIKLISATTGIPHRILTGSERGELASSQDRSNWNDRISERRQEFAEPAIRQLVERLVQAGVLPEAEFEVVWPDGEELDEFEKAEVSSKLSASNVLTVDEIRERIYKMEPKEVDDTVPAPPVMDEEEEEELRAAFDLADKAADEPEWKSVHRVGDAHRDSLSAALERHWSDLELVGLEAALEVGDEDGAITILRAEMEDKRGAVLDELEARLLDTLADGGEAALRSSRARGSLVRRGMFRSAAVFSGSFDGKNFRASQWAALRAAELLTEVTPEIVEAVRKWIAAGLAEGIPPAKLAAQVRKIVGLRSDQAEALVNLAARLRDANPGTLVKAGKVRIRVPSDGITEERLARETERYASRLRSQRARLISRTETMRAANEGQRELWRQAVEAGDLPRGVQRTWIATPDERTRASHAERDGVTVGVDEPWPWGTEPGAEPNCRCAQGLVA